jgi:ADP-ribose pyrophosphatase
MIVDRKNKYKGGFLDIDELTVKTKKGSEVKREVMVRKNAVAALVYDTSKEEYVLASQWRPGAASDLIEVVAGTLDKPGEDPRDAMKREIMEEIGYETDSIKLIDECYMSPGGTTEVITIYYAEVSKQVESGGGHASEHEEIDIIYMNYDELVSTRFKDAKTIIAVNWLKFNKIQNGLK